MLTIVLIAYIAGLAFLSFFTLVIASLQDFGSSKSELCWAIVAWLFWPIVVPWIVGVASVVWLTEREKR